MQPTPGTSIRYIEMISPLLWWELRTWFGGDEIPKLSCRSLELARRGVNNGFNAFLFR
jgi:hypothetical protein